MPERPPERYEPGELERTRENLGRLSPEEAKTMSRILGGEVGVEKTDEALEERYRKLKELNRRKNDAVVMPYRREQEKAETSVSFHPYPVPAASAQPFRPGYIQAVRLAFLASRPEHGLIRRRDAWIQLLFPFLHREIRINPAFLKNGDKIFYNHIENFVLSVRSLLARNRRFALYRIKPGYYRRIMYVYRNWNIEGLHVELSRLQARPRDASIPAATVLFRELFKPLFLLSEIQGDIETETALKHLFDLTLLSVPKKGKEAEIIKELYITARDQIYQVTSRIPARCWPLLLYLTGAPCTDRKTFFRSRKGDILTFLGIDQEDLIQPPEHSGQEQPETVEAFPEEHAEEVQTEEEDLVALQEAAGNHGLELLGHLFPESGWDCIENRPDLTPYFKPICGLPRGVDILSPEDPLHQVTVLAAVAVELCSGFRSMRFRDTEGDNPPSSTLEKLSGSLHTVLDEIIPKHYIGPLTEYCRQFERDPEFPTSRYAEKIRSELYWIKRNYLTPYSYTRAFKGARPAIQKRLPKLFETVAEMTDLLSRILIAEEEGDGRMLDNPHEPFHFEVPGFIPLRVKAYLQRRGEAVSNIRLIRIIHGITAALDYLVNNPESWFYGFEEDIFFRNDAMNDSAPIYSVDPLDTTTVIRTHDDRERQAEEQQKQETFGGLKEAEEFLARRQGAPVSAVIFRMKKTSDAEASRILAGFLRRQVRDWMDGVFILQEGLVLLALPDTEQADALALAFRLTASIREHSESLYAPGAGVVTFPPGCTIKALLQAGTTAAGRSLVAGDGSVVLYRPEENRFERHTGPSESP